MLEHVNECKKLIQCQFNLGGRFFRLQFCLFCSLHCRKKNVWKAFALYLLH